MTFYVTVILALVGFVIYELVSGKLMSRAFTMITTREEDPMRYWMGSRGLFWQMLVIIALVYLALHHLLPGLP
jgi:hypothetical protein